MCVHSVIIVLTWRLSEFRRVERRDIQESTKTRRKWDELEVSWG